MLGHGELPPLRGVEGVAHAVAPGVHPEVEAVEVHGMIEIRQVDPPPFQAVALGRLHDFGVRPGEPVRGDHRVARETAEVGWFDRVPRRDDEHTVAGAGAGAGRVDDDRAMEASDPFRVRHAGLLGPAQVVIGAGLVRDEGELRHWIGLDENAVAGNAALGPQPEDGERLAQRIAHARPHLGPSRDADQGPGNLERPALLREGADPDAGAIESVRVPHALAAR